MTKQQDQLHDLIYSYYRIYYLETLGLQDWRERVLSFRLHEESLIGSKIEQLAASANVSLCNLKTLVVGCGTGAELFYLAERCSLDVRGIEPLDDAIEICTLKAQIRGFSADLVTKESSECMSFADGSMDLIICYSVLEHVADVDATLREIMRVLAPGGKVLMSLPDFGFPEEPHYKVLTLPPAWFPSLVRLQLRWMGRPTGFFDSLNLLTRSQLTRRLKRMSISHQVIREYAFRKNLPFILKVYSYLFGIDRNQLLILSKS